MRPRRLVLATATLVLLVATLPTVATASTSEPDCELRSPAARDAARPDDLADRYGYRALHRAGHDGRGLTAAQLQFGQSVSVPKLRQFQSCLGLREVPFTQLHVRTDQPPAPVDPDDVVTLPPPGREAQSDAEMIVSSAPGLDHLYVLVADSENDFYATLSGMLASLASGEATGGRAPDIVSLSYGACEAQLTKDMVANTEKALEGLARSGTWFFKGAGDAGSTDCAPIGTCTTTPQTASVHYPASSPWVTAVGGVQVTGAQPEGQRATGPGSVWNSALLNPTDCAGGGGGTSRLWDRPAFQDEVPGGAVPTKRGVPDIAALASTPGLLTLLPDKPAAPAGVDAAPAVEQVWSWDPNGGDSLSGPLMAGAFASLRSALVARGLEVPTLVNPVLYRIANDAVLGPKVFRDITTGTNDLYGVGCCVAAEGYDLASGLGEVDLAALLEALEPAGPAVPELPVRPAFTG